MIKVLVADKYRLIRKGISQLLNDVGIVEVIAEAESSEEIKQLLQRADCNPDIVLIDLQMFDISGIAAIRKLLQTNPKIKILLIVDYDNDLFSNRSSEEISGYITKDTSAEEMIRAVREIYAGQRYICPELAQKVALGHFSGKPLPSFNELSKRELEVMGMIVRGQKVQQIAKLLGLSPKTVNTYRYRIFDKLEVNSDVELTHLAIRYGVVDSCAANDVTNSEE